MLHISTHYLADQIVESIAEDTPELLDNLEAGLITAFRIETEIQGKPALLRILIAKPEWDRDDDDKPENPEIPAGAADLISEAQSIAKHTRENIPDIGDN